jgi:hypothetical protein
VQQAIEAVTGRPASAAAAPATATAGGGASLPALAVGTSSVPLLVEYAKSGRALCRECQTAIAADELRLAIVRPPDFENPYEQKLWCGVFFFSLPRRSAGTNQPGGRVAGTTAAALPPRSLPRATSRWRSCVPAISMGPRYALNQGGGIYYFVCHQAGKAQPRPLRPR